jgi:DNA-binding transcriptional regulator GbsR (MarR family)
MERFKGDIKETKKLNRKLQLRVQTFEKKLELQHIKEQRITEMLDKTNENFETKKLEQETYFLLVFRFSVSENILFVFLSL